MKMTKSLCTNCDNTTDCVMKNGHPVLQCEEHAVVQYQEIQTPIKNTVAEVQTNPANHFEGLCITCDLMEDCAWQKANIITFHCEHYQ